MKTVKTIFAEAPKVRDILSNQHIYFAHTSSKGSTKSDELLDEHVELVNRFVERLCNSHGLDEIIDHLIMDLVKGVSFFNEQRTIIEEAIKERFVYGFLFHDFGKINVNYQREKMQKTELFPKEEAMPFNPASGHSELSTYCYLRYFSPKEMDETAYALFYMSLLFSYPIVRHHASNLWEVSQFFKDRKYEWVDEQATFEQLWGKYNLKTQPIEYFQQMITGVDDVLNWGEGIFKEKSFQLFALVKLSFSLLTASDYLATSVYANDEDYTIAGVINDALRKHIVNAAKTSLPYNKAIFEALDDTDFQFLNPRDKGNIHLNRLRFEMGVRVIKNIRENKKEKVFYIEAPTGGGKTNLSMLATAELLRLKPKLNKVVYVFPFTTLVTQTFAALQKTFDLKGDQITQLHSKAGYKQHEKEAAKDGYYGNEKRDYLTYLFNHFPVALCTHIRFFDWLKTERKESNYIFHRLANSIVVIDELQAYAPQHWDKVIYYIQQFAQYFNTRFIIMSATLPKLGDLLPKLGPHTGKVTALLPNAKELYFKNPNFSGRISFDTSLMDEQMTIDRLAKEVIRKSTDYAGANSLFPDSVYTIVECIFKQTATDLYQEIESLPTFFDHVWVLSGTILEHRRRLIINRLKNEEYRKKRILLITTQVVEAGVNIDMDIGFKDQSILDSDEQLAGRINRNVNKDVCKLYLFRKDRASILYKNDPRFSLSQEYLTSKDIQEILEQKDFDRLYDLVFEQIVKDNECSMIANHKSYLNTLNKLDFQEVSRQFQLIEHQNLSLFVPLQIPIEVESVEIGKNERMFSVDELDFLSKNGIENTSTVCGEKVFDLFLKIIKKEVVMSSFIENKTNFIRLKGIMSRFIFSMYASDKFERKIQSFIDPEKSESGYIYLLHYEKIYDEKTGLDQEAMDDVTQQIIG